MNRRQFLAASAAVAAVAANASEENETVFPVIDTHQHLWDLSRFRLPWQKNEPKLAKNHLIADYLAATADLGEVDGRPARIVKTVYMEVDVEPSQQKAEAEYVLDLCSRADNPMVAAVISGRPNADGFAKYLDAFKNSVCIKGVRQVLHVTSNAGGILSRQEVHPGHSPPGRARSELRPVHASGRIARRGQVDRRMSRNALHSRPLRQRRRAVERSLAMGKRHGGRGRAQACRLQGIGHCRDGEAGQVDARTIWRRSSSIPWKCSVPTG